MAVYSVVAVRRTPSLIAGAVPSYVGSGTHDATTSGAITPSIHASTAVGDGMLLVVEQNGGDAQPSPDPTGWDLIGHHESQAFGFSDTTQITVWGRIYEAGDAAPSVPDMGNHHIGQVHSFRGVDPADFPHKLAFAGTATNDTSVDSFNAVVTTVDNCLVVGLLAQGASACATSAWANASLGSVTKRTEVETTAGTDGTLTMVTGTLATAGNSGAFSATSDLSQEEATATIALAPAGGAPTFEVLGPLACSIQWTDTLNEPTEGEFSMDIEGVQDDIKDAITALDEEPLEVWVYRDSTMVFAGPVVGGEVNDAILSLSCRGVGFYMDYMVIAANTDWAAEDQYDIAKEPVDDWQALDYGDFGIVTSGIGSSGTTRTISVFGATEPVRVLEFVSQLADVDNGFDWHVVPSTRALTFEAARGSDLSATVFLERGVVSPNIRFTVAPDVVASEMYGIGTGEDSPTTTEKNNATLRASFGRCASWVTLDGDPDSGLLDDATQRALDLREGAYFAPGPGLLSVTGAEVDDFDTGDTVTYAFDAGLGQQSGAFRVYKRVVDVGVEGQETMTVEFE